MDLHEWLEVDPTSPSGLRWKKSNSNRKPVGAPAGCKNHDGYWTVRVNGQHVLAHRAVLFLSGVLPKSEGLVVDHINRNRLDNRLENLRWVTSSENARNTEHYATPFGFKWVHRRPGKRSFKFRQIINGKVVLAQAITPSEAFYRGLARRLELFWI